MDLSIKPGSDSYFNKIVDQFFTPLFEGHSTLIETVPKSGVRGFIRYMINFPEYLNKKFAEQIKNINIIWISSAPHDDEKALLSALSLIEARSRKLSNFTETSQVADFILNSRHGTAIIVNQAEQLLNDGNSKTFLTSLYDMCAPKLVTALIATRELTDDEKKTLTIPFTIFKTGYIPLKGAAEMELLLEKEKIWNDIEITDELKEFIVEKSGGYSTLARALLEELKDERGSYSEISIDDLLEVDAIKERCKLLFSSLTAASQKECFKVLLQLPARPPKFITATEIIRGGGFFSPIFERFLLKKHNESFNITLIDSMFSIYDAPLQSILSPQQFLVAKLLIEKCGEIVSREEIARCIWGNKWSIEYSDWAIDSLIRNLRKKLMIEKETAIWTVKNKGFRYSSILCQ